MSYYKGVFFLNNKGIAHATYKNGKVITSFHPISLHALIFLLTRLIFSTPIYFLLLGLMLIILIERPSVIFSNLSFANTIPELPLYTFILFLFSYHFIFPVQLKKYHGAEHKVFSYRGRKHLAHAKGIQIANIVNRYCSTNAIVLFFTFFLLSFPFVNGWIATLIGWIAILIIPRLWKWADDKLFFPISAMLQKKITTAEPDEIHLRVAILSYMSLQAQRALNEDEVWKNYYQELEELKKAEEERQRMSEIERIYRLIEEEERKQILFDHYRDSLLIDYISKIEHNNHSQETNNAIYK